MTLEPSLWSFIVNADVLVKAVMIILLVASITSWAIIIQRYLLLKQINKENSKFEKEFWSGLELNQLYKLVPENQSGIGSIFRAGFKEFVRAQQHQHLSAADKLDNTQRAMRIRQSQEIDFLENHVSILATVGSISPYIGLFGTVWGIMSAFRALGAVQQATIAMVAPGIAEALIATAVGLFAAIPAVIAYNRFANKLQRIANRFDNFQEEFTNILQRQLSERG